jgi:hypothetical protein
MLNNSILKQSKKMDVEFFLLVTLGFKLKACV